MPTGEKPTYTVCDHDHAETQSSDPDFDHRRGSVPPGIQPALRCSPATPRACVEAIRPLDPELCLDQVLCFKHRRKVARDNTVRFQLHTLQLLPGPERPSYAKTAVEVLESLDGRLSVRHEGRIVPAQEAPPSPVFLRNGHGPTDAASVPSSGASGLGERWTSTLPTLDSRAENERDQGTITDSAATAGKPKTVSPRKPTFLQRERSDRGRYGLNLGINP